MMSGLWYEYLRALDSDMPKQNRQTILLVDSAPTHPHPNSPLQTDTGPTPPVLTYIRLEFLLPNITTFPQPLDAGIIRALKAAYRRQYVTKIADYIEAHSTAAPNLDVLELIHMISDAWMKITPDTIFHCGQKVGIVEIQDKTVFKNYTAFCEEIKHATEKIIVGVKCNSQQVEDLSHSFLEFGEDAFDPEQDF